MSEHTTKNTANTQKMVAIVSGTEPGLLVSSSYFERPLPPETGSSGPGPHSQPGSLLCQAGQAFISTQSTNLAVKYPCENNRTNSRRESTFRLAVGG